MFNISGTETFSSSSVVFGKKPLYVGKYMTVVRDD